MDNTTERLLIVQIKQSNEQAFQKIYKNYYQRILMYSFRFLKDESMAEEIVQECFLCFWEMRLRLDEQLPAGPLLYTIARRLTLNELRKIANSRTAKALLWKRIQDIDESTQLLILANDLERFSEEALHILSPQQRKVFCMSRNEGMSHEEIAQHLQISTSTVNNHLVESLKKMRVYFQKNGIMNTILFFLK